MIQIGGYGRSLPQLNTLEACAASAGVSLACPFSSSEEFEAELIRERREAGAYQTSASWRHLMLPLTVILTLVALLLLD
jgi:hypothetical protein